MSNPLTDLLVLKRHFTDSQPMPHLLIVHGLSDEDNELDRLPPLPEGVMARWSPAVEPGQVLTMYDSPRSVWGPYDMFAPRHDKRP